MKKTVIFSFLTFLLLFLVIVGGIPFLIRMTTLLGELKSSGEIVETEDTTPPFPPKLRPLPEATNSGKITLQGLAEPGATVKIFLNEEVEKEIVAEVDGIFIAEEIELALGKNKIMARARDWAGNESKDSGIIIIEYDKTPPELEIKTPENNASFSGEEKQIEVVGKTEVGATLKLNDHLVILDHEGNFSYSLTLSEEENTILIEAKDVAGNKTEKEITVSYSP